MIVMEATAKESIDHRKSEEGGQSSLIICMDSSEGGERRALGHAKIRDRGEYTASRVQSSKRRLSRSSLSACMGRGASLSSAQLEMRVAPSSGRRGAIFLTPRIRS